MSKEKKQDGYTIKYPTIVAGLGIAVSIISAIFIIIVIILFDETLEYLTLVIFAVFFLLGCYLFFKGCFWKVIVNEESFMVYRLLGHNYSFSLADIKKVRRQTKKTYYGIKERLIITTYNGKKVVIEDFAYKYILIKGKMKNELENVKMEGFDN